MNAALDDLIATARQVPMSTHDRQEQRKSFAYGNTNIENSQITRELIAEAATRLSPDAQS